FIISFILSLGFVVEKVGHLLEYLYIAFGKLISRRDNSTVSKSKISEGIEDNQVQVEEGLEFDDFLKHLDEEKDELDEDEVEIDNPFKEKINKKSSILKTLSKIKPDFSNAEEEKVEETLVKKPRKRVTPTKNYEDGELPNTDLLTNPPKQVEKISTETLEFVSVSIENKLSEFGVEAKVVNAETGPVITRYELLPSRGVRGDKIVGLSKEIARGLALTNVRVVETIPGKNSMGIEVPNFKRQIIYIKEIFDSVIYRNSHSKLTLALGKDIAGDVIVTDLAKMPHLLVA
ncbi:predicted protein, partial [Nematostella vectensis]